MKIKFDSNVIKYISLFESLTNARVKDCFEDNQDTLVFVVENGDIVKAIGKNGDMAKKLKDIIKRKIKIVEYNDDIIEFIRSLILPLKTNAIDKEEDIVYLKSDDVRTKGLLIGKAASNLRNYEFIVKRYFDIKEIKVVDYT